MSAVIELLEQMGSDSSLNQRDGFEAAIGGSALNAELKEALLSKDTSLLKQQLNAANHSSCMLIVTE